MTMAYTSVSSVLKMNESIKSGEENKENDEEAKEEVEGDDAENKEEATPGDEEEKHEDAPEEEEENKKEEEEEEVKEKEYEVFDVQQWKAKVARFLAYCINGGLFQS